MTQEAVPAMWDDERPIREIALAGDGGDFWTVGHVGVTRIVVYRENGQGASVPWLAVYRGDWLASRVNAAHVENIWYGTPPDEE